ncbi:hypothetical protein Taro_045489 [Colocasia esculenta]|uniref:Uncharacterized protein n=1 Tax=Colocasia esculenta TaxID=4460 RepID=A0A843X2V6_COLES|nr:hypothetical protein [Colocasia esculenta]
MRRTDSNRTAKHERSTRSRKTNGSQHAPTHLEHQAEEPTAHSSHTEGRPYGTATPPMPSDAKSGLNSGKHQPKTTRLQSPTDLAVRTNPPATHSVATKTQQRTQLPTARKNRLRTDHKSQGNGLTLLATASIGHRPNREATRETEPERQHARGGSATHGTTSTATTRSHPDLPHGPTGTANTRG